MNNMNHLEKHLESWIPRPPSTRLKDGLFTTTETPRVIPFPLWLKIAPVACILLILAFFSLPRREQVTCLAVSGGSNVLASLSSNLMAYCASGDTSGRENLWSGVTFDWTKDDVSLSTTRSFLMGKTNIQKL